MTRRGLLLFLAILLAAGCSGRRYKVRTAAKGEWFVEARRSALDSGKLSDTTLGILRRRSMLTLAKTDVRETILRLDEEMRTTLSRSLALAIAELSFRESDRWSIPNRTILGTTLRYSYAYLFDPKLEPAPEPFDIRFRWACDMYNRTLARFVRIAGSEYKPDDSPLDWLTGSTVVSPGELNFNVSLEELTTISVAYDYEIEGLPPPQRFEGLGAPCVVIAEPALARGEHKADRFLTDRIAVAATFVVRFPDDASILDDPQQPGVYDIYDPTDVNRIRIGGREVPLEVDYTTPVVWSLAQSKDQSPGISALFNAERWEKRGGLYSLQPTRPDRIPVVLVHGVASDPLTWIPLYNDLMSDEKIRKNFQFLVWFYPTGQPASYTAYQLRSAMQRLHDLAREAHPDSPYLDSTVVLGHSLGGVISHMLVIDPGTRLEEEIFTRPIAEMAIKDRDKELLSDVIVYESLRFVTRVIFYATPHGGAANADKGIYEWLAGFIKLPQSLLDPQREIFKYQRDYKGPATVTSIEAIKPEGPIMRIFREIPINERVTYHSIIGDIDEAGKIGGSDGYVPYESAHIEGAASELILKSDHSVQHQPLAARETRRILLAHLKQFQEAQAKR